MDNLDMKILKAEFDALDETVRRQFRGFEDFVSFKRAGAGEFVADPACCFSDSSANVAIETAVEFDEAMATDDQLKEHFAQTQQVQDEFHRVESYLAYVHHEVRKRGERAKRLSHETVNGFDEMTATDDQLKAHFAETQQVQDEFHNVGSYLSFWHGEKYRAERESRLSERHEKKRLRAERLEHLAESA